MSKQIYYHASNIKDIEVLKPHISNHKKPLIYFSSKRENVLVYLSNAIEKYCKETNFKHEGYFTPWGPYGFTEDGLFQLEEYYPNAIEETYKGVSGYIYSTSNINDLKSLPNIKDVYVTEKETKIVNVEYIEDAYTEIIKAEQQGLIKIIRYEEFIKIKKDWLIKTIQNEYDTEKSKPEYIYFLKNKFPFIKL